MHKLDIGGRFTRTMINAPIVSVKLTSVRRHFPVGQPSWDHWLFASHCAKIKGSVSFANTKSQNNNKITYLAVQIIGHVNNVIDNEAHLCDWETLQIPVRRGSGNGDGFSGS